LPKAKKHRNLPKAKETAEGKKQKNKRTKELAKGKRNLPKAKETCQRQKKLPKAI